MSGRQRCTVPDRVIVDGKRRFLGDLRQQALYGRIPSLYEFTGSEDPALLPRTHRLTDGTTGWFARWMRLTDGYWAPRTDDCLAACLATILQVPIDELPDPRIDERLERGEDPAEIDQSAQAELARWLAERGLRMVTHRKLPWSLPRWLAVVDLPGVFMDHAMVMGGDKVLFDPTVVWWAQRGQAYFVRHFDASAINRGYSFASLRQRKSQRQ